jgi:hypothetical protein
MGEYVIFGLLSGLGGGFVGGLIVWIIPTVNGVRADELEAFRSAAVGYCEAVFEDFGVDIRWNEYNVARERYIKWYERRGKHELD